MTFALAALALAAIVAAARVGVPGVRRAQRLRELIRQYETPREGAEELLDHEEPEAVLALLAAVDPERRTARDLVSRWSWRVNAPRGCVDAKPPRLRHAVPGVRAWVEGRVVKLGHPRGVGHARSAEDVAARLDRRLVVVPPAALGPLPEGEWLAAFEAEKALRALVATDGRVLRERNDGAFEVTARAR